MDSRDPERMRSHKSGLKVEGLCVEVPPRLRIQDAALDVRPGQIVGLVGPNGSGKSMMLNCIGGQFRRCEGRILLSGVRIDRLPAWRRAQTGVARLFQRSRLPADTTVGRHLALASAVPLHSALPWDTVRALNTLLRPPPPELVDALSEIGLYRGLSQLTGTLSHGQLRAVDLLCVMAQQRQLVLLDEPFAGVGVQLRPSLQRWIVGAAGAGAAILVVDHEIGLLRDLCDALYEMDPRDGRVRLLEPSGSEPASGTVLLGTEQR